MSVIYSWYYMLLAWNCCFQLRLLFLSEPSSVWYCVSHASCLQGNTHKSQFLCLLLIVIVKYAVILPGEIFYCNSKKLNGKRCRLSDSDVETKESVRRKFHVLNSCWFIKSWDNEKAHAHSVSFLILCWNLAVNWQTYQTYCIKIMLIGRQCRING